MWKHIVGLLLLVCLGATALASQDTLSAVRSEIMEWAVGILLTITGFSLVYILNSIKNSIDGLKGELRTTNQSLSHLGVRVAYLEGRLFPDKPLHVGREDK